MTSSEQPTYVFHIGQSKCGSSALQTALSNQPKLKGADGKKFEYIALTDDGQLLRADTLRAAASYSPWGYVSSLAGSALSRLADSTLELAVRELFEIRQSGTVPILSCESWLTEGQAIIDSPLVTGSDVSAFAVAYVRPHAEWVNSAWWQWGAWGSQTFDEWFESALDQMLFGKSIWAWAQQPGISRLSVRQLPVNIGADFGSLIGISDLPGISTNRGPTVQILRLFQRHSDLRPDPHASAIDFIAERIFGTNGGAKPWVLNPAQVQRILDASQDDMRVLRQVLPADQRAMLESDLRWSDPFAYHEFGVSPAHAQSPSADEVDALAAAAIHAIQRLDDENRAIRWERECVAAERTQLQSELKRAEALVKGLANELQQLQASIHMCNGEFGGS